MYSGHLRYGKNDPVFITTLQTDLSLHKVTSEALIIASRCFSLLDPRLLRQPLSVTTSKNKTKTKLVKPTMETYGSPHVNVKDNEDYGLSRWMLRFETLCRPFSA